MANFFLRSSDGNDADAGTTWALAKATITSLVTLESAGDVLYVDSAHSESTAGAVTIAMAGTLASPNMLLSVDSTGDPVSPTTVLKGAQITTTGANAIAITGFAYIYGFIFTSSDGGVRTDFTIGGPGGGNNTNQTYEQCDFIVKNTNASTIISIRADGANVGIIEFVDCGVQFGAAGQSINVCGGQFLVKGLTGLMGAGGVSPTKVFNMNACHYMFIDGFDFSAFANTVVLLSQPPQGTLARFRNGKMPAGWNPTTNFASAPTVGGARIEAYNIDAGNTNYKIWIEDQQGLLREQVTTLVKTGGASDGDTPISWKIVTTANPEYPLLVFRSPEIFTERITTTGTAKTVTVDILHDSATNLKDNQVWIEVQYLGNAGSTQSDFAYDSPATVLTAAQDQAASTATWDTTGMANPNKQKLSVTFTPQQKGVAIVTVCVAVASKTLYVDPLATLS